MKEYNARIIVDNDNLKLMFECDKEQNINCKGYGNCRECNYTTNSRHMKAKHITDKEVIKSLESEIDYYRHKIDLLEKIREENRQVIKDNDRLIKEYQDTLNSIIDNVLDSNIKETTVNNLYADGKIVKTIIDYKYNKEAEIKG